MLQNLVEKIILTQTETSELNTEVQHRHNTLHHLSERSLQAHLYIIPLPEYE